jgi:hypothetical protein
MPLTDFRRDLLALIPPAVDLLAPTPSTAFVWPTENCSIGCAHCNFASLPRRPGQPSDLTLDPAGLVGWLVDAGARGLTLCGGGEPLDERDFCDEVVGRVGRTGLDFAVYTSGVSLSDPVDAAACVRRWARLRGRTHAGGFWVRLSMDPFHTERIGDAVLADWIRAIERYAPEWRVSLRGLRLLGDDGLPVLAGRLGAEVRNRGRSTRLVLPSGRSVAVERMGWVFDGRGTPELLARRGLRLPDADAVAVRPWQELVGRTGRLGRPLSRRLTVGRRHVDLEIHADTAVHVLEAQPFDARLRLDRHDWATSTTGTRWCTWLRPAAWSARRRCCGRRSSWTSHRARRCPSPSNGSTMPGCWTG